MRSKFVSLLLPDEYGCKFKTNKKHTRTSEFGKTTKKMQNHDSALETQQQTNTIKSSYSLCESTHLISLRAPSAPAPVCAPTLALDISKNSIQVFDGKTHVIVPTTELSRIVDLNPAIVYMEGTGMYHRPICKLLQQSNIPFVVINAKRILDFKEYKPTVKTDKVDAEKIWHFARIFQPRNEISLGGRLEELLRRHKIVSDTIKSFKNKKEDCVINEETTTTLFLQEQIKYFERLKQRLERALDCHLPKELLDEFGTVFTATMLSYQPSKYATSRKWCGFLGMGLKTKESGMFVGKRFLTRAGPSRARQLLYIRLMSLLKYRREPYYSYFVRCKDRGMVGRMAMVATMRKLARIFWAKTQSAEDKRIVSTKHLNID